MKFYSLLMVFCALPACGMENSEKSNFQRLKDWLKKPFSTDDIQRPHVLKTTDQIEQTNLKEKPSLYRVFSEGSTGMKNNFHEKLVFELLEQTVGSHSNSPTHILAYETMRQQGIAPERIFDEALNKQKYQVAQCIIDCSKIKLDIALEISIAYLNSIKKNKNESSEHPVTDLIEKLKRKSAEKITQETKNKSQAS